jgi:hypothetical protein
MQSRPVGFFNPKEKPCARGSVADNKKTQQRTRLFSGKPPTIAVEGDAPQSAVVHRVARIAVSVRSARVDLQAHEVPVCPHIHEQGLCPAGGLLETMGNRLSID